MLHECGLSKCLTVLTLPSCDNMSWWNAYKWDETRWMMEVLWCCVRPPLTFWPRVRGESSASGLQVTEGNCYFKKHNRTWGGDYCTMPEPLRENDVATLRVGLPEVLVTTALTPGTPSSSPLSPCTPAPVVLWSTHSRLCPGRARLGGILHSPSSILLPELVSSQAKI